MWSASAIFSNLLALNVREKNRKEVGTQYKITQIPKYWYQSTTIYNILCICLMLSPDVWYFSTFLFLLSLSVGLWWLWIQTADSHEVDNNGPHALHGNTIYFPLHQCTPKTVVHRIQILFYGQKKNRSIIIIIMTCTYVWV